MDAELNDLLSDGEQAGDGLARRRFLRSAAITGLAAAWSAPIIQTIAPEIALAQSEHHPRPGTRQPPPTPTGDTPVPNKCDSDSDNSADGSFDFNGNNSVDDSDDSDCDGDTDDHKNSNTSHDTTDDKKKKHDKKDSEPDWRWDSSSDRSDD